MKTLDKKIWLASKSPRRRELLRQIGVDFELLLLRDAGPRGPDVTEIVLPNETAEDYVKRVTLEKAEFAMRVLGQRRLPARAVLTADTTVVLDGQILGKPKDQAQAQAMLASLAGRSHLVLTSIALALPGKSWQHTQCSEVEFSPLTPTQIAQYCASGEPYDKAGGYGIQGLAAAFIARIHGSYSGIMGLPLYETVQLLQQADIGPL